MLAGGENASAPTSARGRKNACERASPVSKNKSRRKPPQWKGAEFVKYWPEPGVTVVRLHRRVAPPESVLVGADRNGVGMWFEATLFRVADHSKARSHLARLRRDGACDTSRGVRLFFRMGTGRPTVLGVSPKSCAGVVWAQALRLDVDIWDDGPLELDVVIHRTGKSNRFRALVARGDSTAEVAASLPTDADILALI